MSEQLSEQIYRLHCQGHAVSKIAKRLGMIDDEVREAIVAKWKKDKHEAASSKKLLGW